jgi:peptidyl-prolyl cis-trans isomerase-like 3
MLENCAYVVQNFLALCASGGYDNSPIHRLVPSFMFQTGSPASASTKTSTSIWQEPFEDEIRSTLRHNVRGIVSMANKGPSTNGSQFFICLAPAPHLDGKNTVFGKVIGGDEVLAKIEQLPVDGKHRPRDKVAINQVTMHANPLAG